MAPRVGRLRWAARQPAVVGSLIRADHPHHRGRRPHRDHAPVRGWPRPAGYFASLTSARFPSRSGRARRAETASVTDLAAMTAACVGVEAVIHLGGIASESSWERILDVNIDGTCSLFEAARRPACRGWCSPRPTTRSGSPRARLSVPDFAYPATDTYYGASKAAGEAVAALYARRYGFDAICIRILSCFERPTGPRMLGSWLSPDDAGRLFEACLTAPSPGFQVIYGVSANTRGGWVSLDGARALGYQPLDDAEIYAAELIAAQGEPPPRRPCLPLPRRRLHLPSP